MKDRTITTSNQEATQQLAELLKPEVSPTHYQATLQRLGELLAEELVESKIDGQSFCLASTAEDADYLAKGMLRTLEKNNIKVYLACFWNEHTKPFKDMPSTAPILKKFIEPKAFDADSLIIVKSIISGGCVVKTNLTNLVEMMKPSRILISAPVIHDQAEQKLKDEFPEETSEKFEFSYFAKDHLRDESGVVKPGIGDEFYKKLGFDPENKKNTFTPKIVLDKFVA